MNNIWLKIISISEIVGGGFGVLLTIYLLFVSSHNIFSFIFFPIFFAINFLCLFAGIFLWKKKPLGKTLSIITQFIHLPKLVSPALTFIFSFGIDIYPYIKFFNGKSLWGIEFKLITFYQFFINMKDAPIGFGLSIIAIVFLVILFRYNPNDLLENPIKKDIPPTPNEYSDIGGD